MRKFLFIMTMTALVLAGTVVSNAQVSTVASGRSPRAVQQHLIGEVTAVDQATGQITVKTDAGSSVTVAVDERTIYRRMPPGQTSLERAEQITRADVKAGDRVLVPNGASASQAAARQVIVMAREAVAARREQEREDWRARGANGRVTAIDAAKKELTVEGRSREGAETLTVVASGNVRFRRYAQGSLRPADAVPGSFADIRVGDTVRVLGNRDGTRLTAEEIISGTIARLTGTVESVEASRNEVTVKDGATGRIITVSLGANTTVRRIPAEFAETLRQRREQRRESGAAGEGQSGERRGRRRGEGNRRGEGGQSGQGGQGGERQRGGGGRGPQQMLENLPAITLAELKKGDAVAVTGTTSGGDASRVTAATFITGDAEILQRMQRRGGGRPENMSPGLPGGVVGGGTGDRDQPRN
ncbi:MAG TPA: hypothetical protein VM934_01660 [Pyrinomonadaceae bacterium]|nr:hypothetical protein [Pyrinomonadaceae bacterium]